MNTTRNAEYEKTEPKEGRNEEARNLSSTKNLRGNRIRSKKFLSSLALEMNRDDLCSDSGKQKVSIGEIQRGEDKGIHIRQPLSS